MVWLSVLDWKLLEKAKPAIERKEKVYAEFPISGIQTGQQALFCPMRSLKYIVAAGLPEDTIHFRFTRNSRTKFRRFQYQWCNP